MTKGATVFSIAPLLYKCEYSIPAFVCQQILPAAKSEAFYSMHKKSYKWPLKRPYFCQFYTKSIRVGTDVGSRPSFLGLFSAGRAVDFVTFFNEETVILSVSQSQAGVPAEAQLFTEPQGGRVLYLHQRLYALEFQGAPAVGEDGSADFLRVSPSLPGHADDEAQLRLIEALSVGKARPADDVAALPLRSLRYVSCPGWVSI